MRIVDYAVDYRYQMSADTDNEPAHWKLTVPQVDFAAGADAHGRRPTPAERGEVSASNILWDARPCTAAALAASSWSRHAVQHVVNRQVVQLGCNRDCPRGTIPCGSPEASRCAATVVLIVFHKDTLAVTFIPVQFILVCKRMVNSH